MSLDELIAALKAAPQDAVLAEGFARPHSYRGYYDELAFEPAANVTVASMLAAAEGAVDKTFLGYKGGDYVMSPHTPVWLAKYGATGDMLSPLALRAMLATAAQPAATLRALAASPAPSVELETTEGERAHVREHGKDSTTAFARAHRDLDRALAYANAEHERAEGLAKEVERLTNYVENNDYIGGWRKRAEAAEAKLAAYEAPVGDGEIADAIANLDRVAFDPEATLETIDAANVGAQLVRRLSATIAQREGENKKLQEVLASIAAEQKVYKGHGDFDIIPLMTAEEAQSIARAALSGEEGA